MKNAKPNPVANAIPWYFLSSILEMRTYSEVKISIHIVKNAKPNPVANAIPMVLWRWIYILKNATFLLCYLLYTGKWRNGIA